MPFLIVPERHEYFQISEVAMENDAAEAEPIEEITVDEPPVETAQDQPGLQPGIHYGARMSDLTATVGRKESKLFWDMVRIFREWAHVRFGRPGVDAPSPEGLKRAIGLGQTFEWRSTGTNYKLVIGRDHLSYNETDYDKVEFYVYICAEVNFVLKETNKKACEIAGLKAREFTDLVDQYLAKKGLAHELKAYHFRRGEG